MILLWCVIAGIATGSSLGTIDSGLKLQSGLFSVLLNQAFAVYQSEIKSDDDDENDKSTAKFPNQETERLAIYVGPWSVTERHYNERGEEIATVKGSEEIVWVLDFHAIGRTYSTTHGDSLYRATSTLKWIPSGNAYTGVWFDSNPESRPNNVTGEWNDAEKTMMWKMEVVGRDGAKKNFKIVEKFPDPERREATTYQMDGSTVTKILVVQYKRTIPCPGKIRTFFGG